ncbi:MAG: OB-fold domain-containing protein [Candidatus Rokubacteria bacterium]|nr:OB-fold domain-containing protein [Candidatus Rokubacteria bacterium]
MSEPSRASGESAAAPIYLRAVDPFPLESPDFNKLHEFYAYLAVERLTTTRCKGCGRIDWPPRGFCPACKGDAYDWVDLPHEGRVHGFTVQETGVPAGYPRPLIFAIVEVAGLRIFAPLVDVADPARLAIGVPVRFTRLRVADDPQGKPRYLPAFTPAEAAS